ncbi:MAG: glycosyltransferase family 2 protein [Phycisphaerales bacterium]|nr:glycosyltransferase family 2 protein [Phycisphaerales bacterium]
MTASPPRPTLLLALPVFNEAPTVERVISRVRRYCSEVLVVDDGSTDLTSSLLMKLEVDVVHHCHNMGYGRSMRDIFAYAVNAGFEWVLVMDCDEQHEPESIPAFIAAMAADDVDVVSGSRYLERDESGDSPPPERRRINAILTDEINEALGLGLTDSFCGFKAYRTAAIRKLTLGVDGYEFPLQFWVQTVAHGLRIREIPVRLIYNDPSRTFGGPLDDPTHRLQAYRSTFEAELTRCRHLLELQGVSKSDARGAPSVS